MNKLFGIPVYESKEAGGDIYFMPAVNPVVYIPPGGFSPEETTAAEQSALIEAYTQAARRGEVAIIRNVEK